MNQVFNQSKNKRIIVISFQSLSPVSNTATNVFELFASFKAANALNHWNLSLIQAVQNCILVGHIDPHVIMLGGSENYLEIIKLAWMKQILKSPLGFTIQYLGELCNFLVSKTPQCSTMELEEAVCKCVCELVNTGLPSNLKYIIRHVTKFLPMTGDNGINDNESFLSTEMVKSIIDGLQQKGLVYNTGHGYNVMTADKLRVAKWLGELPDLRMSFGSGTGHNCDERRLSQTIQTMQKPVSRFASNAREQSENTEDCLSCYDLRGNKYYTQPSGDYLPAGIKDGRICLQTNEQHRLDGLDNDNNNNRSSNALSIDPKFTKRMMLCSHISKKDLSKRPTCVKYESNFISRIICGMKKLRIHWPAKNGVVRSTNVSGVPPEMYGKNYYHNYRDDSTVINSRLSQSMYAFNQLSSQGLEDLPSKVQAPGTCRPSYQPNGEPLATDSFTPYGDTKSISPVPGLACYGLNYTQDIDRSFILMEEQRCCSELMLTGRSSILTPTLYPMVPVPHLCDSDATKTKTPDHKDDQTNSVLNDPTTGTRYFSPFTCDSGFNSVHGGAQMPENETTQSKTSSPPDIAKYSSGPYGGPCAWQVSALNDSVYQTRSYPSAVLSPVIETSRYTK